ncbi:hypothetical protein C8J56DRAFT_898957 [Mycena floridula]|nr:hypothetical protein C8J56DRAFT_901952 [Mycena floridula]KAJ7577320.1 hypothetical protein C8J56DRAFT_898957 [Mycena floridula]
MRRNARRRSSLKTPPPPPILPPPELKWDDSPVSPPVELTPYDFSPAPSPSRSDTTCHLCKIAVANAVSDQLSVDVNADQKLFRFGLRRPSSGRESHAQIILCCTGLKSSDGDSIPFHRSLLAHFGTNITVEKGVDFVDLTAKGEIIDLLVKFMHPHRFPSCANVDFDTILALAHVAEKYQVYSAMQMCNFRLSESHFYRAHPAHVLFYAFHHGYPELADTVAPFALSLKLRELDAACDQNLKFLRAWSLYRDDKADMNRAIRYIDALRRMPDCRWGCTGGLGNTILAECPPPATIPTWESVFQNNTCRTCRTQYYGQHRTDILRILSEDTSIFSSFY